MECPHLEYDRTYCNNTHFCPTFENGRWLMVGGSINKGVFTWKMKDSSELWSVVFVAPPPLCPVQIWSAFGFCHLLAVLVYYMMRTMLRPPEDVWRSIVQQVRYAKHD